MKSLLRYELDDLGKIGITLKEFDSLIEMDEYLKQFNDSNDVKEVYLKVINEFLKTPEAIKFLSNIKPSDDENNGYLRGYTPDKYKLRHVTLIFNNNLLPDEKCYTMLRKNFEENKVLYDLYHRKYFLLPTQFLKDELRHAVVHHGTKRIFIKEFVLYISKRSPEERYFILRILCDKCKLIDNPKKKKNNNFKIRKDKLSSLNNGYKLVKVRHYPKGDFSDEELHIDNSDKVELRDDVSEYDEFSNKNITDLLKEFDIDDLDKIITYFDEMERGRKK